MGRYRAYTLTELRVTIGIIALLAALLFPVITSKARGLMQTAPCMSDMHQRGMGLFLYLQDYHYTSIMDTFWSFDQPGYCWNGMLYPYVRNARAFVCPAHKLPDNTLDWTNPTRWSPILEYRGKSYGINVYGIAKCQATPDGLWYTLKLRYPAERIAFFEVQANDGSGWGDNGWWVYESGVPDGGSEGKRLAFRHSEGMNCVHMDGHAKYHSKRFLQNLMDATKTPRKRGRGESQYLFYRMIYYPWSPDMSPQD